REHLAARLAAKPSRPDPQIHRPVLMPTVQDLAPAPRPLMHLPCTLATLRTHRLLARPPHVQIDALPLDFKPVQNPALNPKERSDNVVHRRSEPPRDMSGSTSSLGSSSAFTFHDHTFQSRALHLAGAPLLRRDH